MNEYDNSEINPINATVRMCYEGNSDRGGGLI